MKTVTFKIIILAATFVLSGCSHELKNGEMGISKDNSYFTVNMAGVFRTGSVHFPPKRMRTKKPALLIGLHGAGQNGKAFEKYGFNRSSDLFGWIVLYPDGISGQWNSLEDNAFISLLIDEMKRQYHIDEKRVYITGHSAGGIQAHECGVVLSEKLAAIAPVSGPLRSDIAQLAYSINPNIQKKKVVPVSVLHLHAVNDDIVPYEGNHDWGILSVKESIGFWKMIDGSRSAEPVVIKEKNTETYIWKNDQADVILRNYETGKHKWPGDAAEIISDFFYNHPERENRITVDREGLQDKAAVIDSLLLRVRISNPDTVKKVIWFSDNNQIGVSKKPPFSYTWRNPPEGSHFVAVRAVLKSGSVIASTMNPCIFVE